MIALFTALTLLAAPPTSEDKESIAPEAATGRTRVPVVEGESFMVVTANPHATRAGADILRSGGSAIDAAIAVVAVLGLVEPQSSGLGGGAFLMYLDGKSGRIQSFDGRETAPASADERLFLKPDGTPRGFFDALVGGLSVGVPGMLRMLESVHQAHGRLPWRALFDRAAALGDDGFEVSPRLHSLLLRMGIYLQGIPETRAYFFTPDGAPKPVGTRLHNPDYADTVREIALYGADAFYLGPIAEDIVAAVQTAPRRSGRLSLDDLATYRAVERPPVCARFRDQRVCSMGPPSSGGITLLQTLALYERAAKDVVSARSVDSWDLFAQASARAFADRSRWSGDEDFAPIPKAGLLNAAYLDARAGSMGPGKHSTPIPAGTPPNARGAYVSSPSPERPSTSHFVVRDRDGNVVSMTASIESAFGSHVFVRGFLLNNQLTDFSFTPTDGQDALVMNRVEAKKRPRSSMTPLIATNAQTGAFELALGSPGGSRIINYVTRVFLEVARFGVPLQESIDAPHVVNRNGKTEIERMGTKREWLETLRTGLEARGHKVSVTDLNSGLHGMTYDGKTLRSGADPRREGCALTEAWVGPDTVAMDPCDRR